MEGHCRTPDQRRRAEEAKAEYFATSGRYQLVTARPIVFLGLYEGRYQVVTAPTHYSRVVTRVVTRSLPGRYRADLLFVSRYEGRYRLVTAPTHYLWVVTNTQRLWFIKLKEERGGAPEVP